MNNNSTANLSLAINKFSHWVNLIGYMKISNITANKNNKN